MEAVKIIRQRLISASFFESASSTLSIRCFSNTAVRPTDPKPVSMVPSPRALPFFGNFFSVMFSKDWNLSRIYLLHGNLFKKFGPIYALNMPFLPKLVFTKNPDDFEKVFRSTMDNPIRTGFDSLKKVRTKELDYYFEKKIGIVVTHEEEWHRVRSQVQTPLMKSKNIHQFVGAMDQVAKDFLDRIELIKDDTNEVKEDFLDEIYKWGLESVATVALNARLGCLRSDITEDSTPMRMINAVKESIVALNKLEFGFPLWKFYPTKEYKALVEGTKIFIEAADKKILASLEQLKTKAPEDEPTLLEILLQNPKLSYKDVTTLIIDMLIGGIDTTSNTFAFALYNLARNPECQNLLQKEIDDLIGDSQDPLTPQHLAKMSYLKAVLKETLRCFPLTMGTTRDLTSNLELSGYSIPKGYTVVLCPMFTGWDEDFVVRPKEFLPERWLRHKPLGPIHPYAVIPFSYGTRMCIGRRIAEQELYTLLTRVFQSYNVEYHHKDMSLTTRLVFQPSEPCRFKFIKRK